MSAHTDACRWVYDADSDSWDTDCGQKHCFIADGPHENGYRFCPYCGTQLKVRRADAEAAHQRLRQEGE